MAHKMCTQAVVETTLNTSWYLLVHDHMGYFCTSNVIQKIRGGD